MKWKAKKWLFLVAFSDLKNNKNSQSYGCSNKAKNRVFRTFRLGLFKNLTCWSSSEAGFGFYGKNYFGNDLQLFQNKTMQTMHLSGRTFDSNKPVKNELIQFFASKNQTFYESGIVKLTERWQKVIEQKG